MPKQQKKNLNASKDSIKKTNTQPKEWEKTFVNHAPDYAIFLLNNKYSSILK